MVYAVVFYDVILTRVCARVVAIPLRDPLFSHEHGSISWRGLGVMLGFSYQSRDYEV